MRNIEEAIRAGPREQQIEEALVRSAVGYTQRVQKSYKVRRVEYNDDGKKSREFDEIVNGYDEKYVPPSVTAQQFWLRNRVPERWGQAVEGEEAACVVELPTVLEEDAPSDEEA